jgi:bacitracin transport system ATP-binding protein
VYTDNIMEHIIHTHDLTKQYKKKVAVDHINIGLRKGEIYGFLGKNGAGKTTTMQLILGLIRPTSGSVELFGESTRPGRNRHGGRIGSIIETPGFYPNLTASENLEIHRRLVGETDKLTISKALDRVGLRDTGKKLVKAFSLGMKQRLGIARAILHSPELLVLDEPNNGLDPEGIKQMRRLYLSLVADFGITIFISSHILSEIDQLAHRICIIDEGRILEEVDTETIRKKNRKYLLLKVTNDREAIRVIETILHIHDFTVTGKGVIHVYDRLEDGAQIVRALVTAGIDVLENTVMKDSLEDYFLSTAETTYHE